MVQILSAAAIVVAAVTVAVVLRARRVPQAPTQALYDVPVQLDRADFAASSPWVVVVFTSSTCAACIDVLRKAQVLQSSEVEVVEAEYTAARGLHAKYAIHAVPIVAIADSAGVVRRGFLGPVTATDLWAAMADARQPGSSPEPTLGQR